MLEDVVSEKSEMLDHVGKEEKQKLGRATEL